MSRVGWIGTCTSLVFLVACLPEGEIGDGQTRPDDGVIDRYEQPATVLNGAAVDSATDMANHGRIGDGRIVSWKAGGFQFTQSPQNSCPNPDNAATSYPDGCETCTYGWCGFWPIGNCSTWKNAEKNDGWSYGACNSTAWGEQWAGELWNNGQRAHYKTNVSGTTTFGYHPYWCVKYDGEIRTYQGWSYSRHCGQKFDFEVGDPPPPPPPPGDFPSRIDKTGLSGSQGSISEKWTVTTTAPPTFVMSGGSGDADLHVNAGTDVSTSNYDCRPWTNGNNETCSMPTAGTYTIMIHGYSSYSGVSLHGGDSGPVCGDNNVDEGEECDGGDCCDDECRLVPANTECRGAGGVCDVAESCDGVSADCPADAKRSSDQVCRDANGDCDVSETCDGANNDCPADTFAPSSKECRPSTGECDQAESCTGSTATCPFDGMVADGTSCSGGTCQGGVCLAGPPAGWTCPDSYYGDGVCDCGCGVPDSDEGCGPSNQRQNCPSGTYCDPGNAACTPNDDDPVDTWTCDPSWYADGSWCDCGCGDYDPDCDTKNTRLWQACTGAYTSYNNVGCNRGDSVCHSSCRQNDPTGNFRKNCSTSREEDGTCDCGCQFTDAVDCGTDD